MQLHRVFDIPVEAPWQIAENLRVYGIGDAKLEQFGEALVTRVREHASSAP